MHGAVALRDPGLQLKNSLTGKKKKLAVEDHEVDHPGHHYGSEDERGQMAQIGVVSITKAIRTEDVPSPRPAVEIISRKEHESVDEETGVPRLDDDATSRLERAIFENAPINHAMALSAAGPLSPPRPLRRPRTPSGSSDLGRCGLG